MLQRQLFQGSQKMKVMRAQTTSPETRSMFWMKWHLLQSTATTPDSAFQQLSKMKRVFINCNTGVPASAAYEQLFSVGKDIFLPKHNRLPASHFEKLLLCRINRHFCFSLDQSTNWVAYILFLPALIRRTLHLNPGLVVWNLPCFAWGITVTITLPVQLKYLKFSKRPHSSDLRLL